MKLGFINLNFIFLKNNIYGKWCFRDSNINGKI
jgi:hypothetical protein